MNLSITSTPHIHPSNHSLPSNDSHLSPLKCHLILFLHRPSFTAT